MKSLKDIILEKLFINQNFIINEKLIINKNIKINHKEYDENDDYKLPIKGKYGNIYQWFSWWKYLWDKGPMTKQVIYDHFALNSNSKYAETFTWLRKHNIIVYNRKLKVLEAIDPEEWKK